MLLIFERYERTITYDKVETTEERALLKYFTVLSQQQLQESEESHENFSVTYVQPEIERNSSRIQIRSVRLQSQPQNTRQQLATLISTSRTPPHSSFPGGNTLISSYTAHICHKSLGSSVRLHNHPKFHKIPFKLLH